MKGEAAKTVFEARKKKQKKKNHSTARQNLIGTLVRTQVSLSLCTSKGAQAGPLQPDERKRRRARRWGVHERVITFLPVHSQLYKQEPEPQSEEAEAFPNNTKITHDCIKELTLLQCAQLLFLKFQAPPPRLFSCTGPSGQSHLVSQSRCERRWAASTSSHLKRQAWKSRIESSARISNAGSAFAKVYFCISEHTNAGACSNSLSWAAHDNSPAAALFDLQCFP